MIGDALMHLHLVGAHDFVRLPQHIPRSFGTAQFYGTVLHALMNDSHRIWVSRKWVGHIWIDGRVIHVSVPNHENNAAAFVLHLLEHDRLLSGLFHEDDCRAGCPAFPLTFRDPVPLNWGDLIRAGRELEGEMESARFVPTSFYAARLRVVTELAKRVKAMAATPSRRP